MRKTAYCMILSYMQGFVACFLDVMYDFFKVPEEVFSGKVVYTSIAKKRRISASVE